MISCGLNSTAWSFWSICASDGLCWGCKRLIIPIWIKVWTVSAVIWTVSAVIWTVSVIIRIITVIIRIMSAVIRIV